MTTLYYSGIFLKASDKDSAMSIKIGNLGFRINVHSKTESASQSKLPSLDLIKKGLKIYRNYYHRKIDCRETGRISMWYLA